MGGDILRKVSWSLFKTSLSMSKDMMNYHDMGDYYDLWDHQKTLSCLLHKGTPDALDFETNNKMGCNKIVNDLSPFASKMVQGKNLFSRTHGVFFVMSSGANAHEFVIPYTLIKFNEVEVLNGEFGDKLDLKVLDDDVGSYSTVPNYVFNQFGFEVCVAKDFYKRKSNYDADLYVNMRVQVLYNSISPKTVGFNFMLHELK